MRPFYFFIFISAFLVYGCKSSYTIHRYKSEKSARLFGHIDLIETNKEDTLLALTYLPASPDEIYVGLVKKNKRDSTLLYESILFPKITLSKTEHLKSTDSLFKITLINKHGFTNQFNTYPNPILLINDSISLGSTGVYDLNRSDRNIINIHSIGLDMFYRLPDLLYYDSVSEFDVNDSIVVHFDHKLPVSRIDFKKGVFKNQFQKPMLISYCDLMEKHDGGSENLNSNAYSFRNISYDSKTSMKVTGQEARKYKRLIKYFFEIIENADNLDKNE